MKTLAIIVVLLVAAAGIIGPQALFTVDETQLAIVTRFGEIQGGGIHTPGLKAKVPFIDSVTYFDKRLLIFDASPDSLLTKDKKRLIIDIYARGRIDDPKLFRETVRAVSQATSRAVDIISSERRREIASDNQAEIITTKREDIMARVRDNISPKLKDFGIEVVDVRIKRADFPAEIADSVYARMQAERKRKADKERAEGAEVDAQVRADVDRQATIIRANAERDSNIVRGCGEAEATNIFARAFNEDPEFFTFVRALEVNRKILTPNDTVVLPVEELGKLFEGIRQGVLQGSEFAFQVNGSIDSDDDGSVCAEVAAVRLVAANLDIDTLFVEPTSITPTVWPDSSLGCPEEGREYAGEEIPGFVATVSYQGISYTVHTNRHGSLMASCSP